MGRSGKCLSLALVYCCIIYILFNHFYLFSSDVEVKEHGENAEGAREEEGAMKKTWWSSMGRQRMRREQGGRRRRTVSVIETIEILHLMAAKRGCSLSRLVPTNVHILSRIDGHCV